MRIIEYLRWQVRLWLVGFGQRCLDRESRLAVSTTFDSTSLFARFVDRVSPWHAFGGGYQRVTLRRWLYRLRHPVMAQRFLSLSLVIHTVYSLAPRPATGRYGSYLPDLSLKMEWLDSHSEYADQVTGDTDTWIWMALFSSVDVPWSLKPETWILSIDSRGFVSADQYADREEAEGDFERADSAYSAMPQ